MYYTYRRTTPSVIVHQFHNLAIQPMKGPTLTCYEIRSEKEYYTVQLFCTAAQDPESLTDQLRKDNRNMKIGRMPIYQMNEVSNDIKDNWNTTYAESKFPPSKAFDGNKIDPGTNRHLQGDTFRKILHMDNLVKYFESRFRQFYVKSVWIIKKTRDNDFRFFI